MVGEGGCRGWVRIFGWQFWRGGSGYCSDWHPKVFNARPKAAVQQRWSVSSVQFTSLRSRKNNQANILKHNEYPHLLPQHCQVRTSWIYEDTWTLWGRVLSNVWQFLVTASRREVKKCEETLAMLEYAALACVLAPWMLHFFGCQDASCLVIKTFCNFLRRFQTVPDFQTFIDFQTASHCFNAQTCSHNCVFCHCWISIHSSIGA